MPVTIQAIIDKAAEIEQTVSFWGAVNPRLFKGIIPEEENNFFLLIKKQEKLSHKKMIEIALEKLLPCNVYVSEEEDLKESVKAKILASAIPLTDKDNLYKVFSKIDFGEQQPLTDEEKKTQAYNEEIYFLVKEDRENKLKKKFSP